HEPPETPPETPKASYEASLFQIVIGLDDLAQLVLGLLVAPVCIGMVQLYQFLELCLDVLPRCAGVEVQGIERLFLDRTQAAPTIRCRGVGLAGLLRPPGEEVGAAVAGLRLLVAAVARAVRPGVRPDFPRRTMTRYGVLLEVAHLVVAHAVEVIVRGI